MQGAGGVFQSVLEKVVFMGGASGPSSSAIVGGLRATSTGGKLSIKFVLYAYEPSSASANFTHGKIVGTVGPHLSGDELHFLAARRLESRGAHAFGSAPFKIDTSRNKVIIDLGNAIPESVPGGARKSHGTLTARIITGGSTTNLGTLDYSQAHYEQTAGVEEVSITAAEATQLASNPLGLHRTNPSNQLVMGEHPNGSYLDVTLSALRLNPGFSPAVELVATEFGAPKSGQSIGLARIKGIPISGLTFPSSVTTNAAGRAAVSLSSAGPGSPRAHIDGQLYKIAFHWGPATPSNRRGEIAILVFDLFTIPASPTWAADVRQILEPYARLYPFMRTMLDLSDHARLKAYAAAKKAAGDNDKANLFMALPETDPRYMPVTRDLSINKKATVLAWIGNGCP